APSAPDSFVAENTPSVPLPKQQGTISNLNELHLPPPWSTDLHTLVEDMLCPGLPNLEGVSVGGGRGFAQLAVPRESNPDDDAV
ncbi:hypothetical protein FRC00_014131, partial [Tulasnella sp. 408]